MLTEINTQEPVARYPSDSLFMKPFSILIPAYNEEKRISPVLQEISSFIYTNNLPWQVIVAVDGNDGTSDIVERMMVHYPFLSVEHGSTRSGKGSAIRRGLNAANCDFVIFMDADGSIKLSDIMQHLEKMEDYDAVVFDRYSTPENTIPFLRRFASRGFNVLVKALLGIRINDTQCGYKILKTEYARRAFRKITVTNTFFDVALLFYLNKLRARILEIPVDYNHDGESKFNVVAETFGQGLSLLAFRLRNSRFYRYVPKQMVDLFYKKFRWI